MKLLQTIRSILSALITVALIAILGMVMFQKVTGEVPGIAGYHFMYVLTGSMEPELHVGDAILVKECDISVIATDDIICYYGNSGELSGKVITHQVVVPPHEESGRTVLQTKGTANNAPDDPISADQVIGKVIARLALLGKVYKFFCTVPGLIVVCIPILLMMFSEIRQIVRVSREQREEDVANAIASAKAGMTEEEQDD